MRYWLTERLWVELFPFCGQSVDHWQVAARNLAFERLDEIAKVLDKRGIMDVRAAVENDFRRRMGDRIWEVYKNGPVEEYYRLCTDVEYDSETSAPSYAVDYLAELAVRVLPDMGAGELADAIRAAAELVELGGVRAAPCDHDWKVDRERTVLERTVGEVVVVYQTCSRCGGIRERAVHPEDHGYEEAMRLADGLQ